MLISDAYQLLNRQLHESSRGFGGSGRKHSNAVMLASRLYSCQSILDYGCGQGTLKTALLHADQMLDVREYDPAIPDKAQLPQKADLVVCTDVLEHVEPACLRDVLEHLHLLSCKATFFVVALTPGSKLLPDGRNTHLIVEPYDWWRQLLKQRWNLMSESIRFDSLDQPTDLTITGIPK